MRSCHRDVVERGIVVWAIVSVASTHLFKRGDQGGRAVVVYPCRMHVHDQPAALESVALALSELLPTAVELAGEEQAWRKRLRNDFDLFAPQAPPGVDPGAGVLAASTLVDRRHLPGGTLVGTCLPVMIHPEHHTPFILPQQFWAPPLRDWWVGRT